MHDFDMNEIEQLEKGLKRSTWDFDYKANTVKFCQDQLVVKVPFAIMNMLYTFQITGVERVLENFARNRKGIMNGDSPGMGKTIQSLVAILSLMAELHIGRVLCILPKNVVAFWGEEIRRIRKCWPSLNAQLIVQRYEGNTVKRIGDLRQNRRSGKPLIVLLSSALVSTKEEKEKGVLFATGYDRKYPWDLIVLDEAHCRAKNKSTQLSEALRSKLTANSFQLFLTATPIQNSLKEHCILLDTMLGNHRKALRDESFEAWYEQNQKSYKAGQQENSTESQRKRKDKLLAEFHIRAKTYFFQRSKEEHLRDKIPKVARYDVWTLPSNAQKDAAARFMKSSDLVENARESKLQAFLAIAKLRQNCLHPYFGSTSTIEIGEEDDESHGDDERNDNAAVEAYLLQTSVSQIKTDSPKLALCADLVQNFVSNGHKVLIFCEFKRPFYFLERLLESMQIGSYRMHGDESPTRRAAHVHDFNGPRSTHQVMLLTFGAAGLGLTLTGADRMIILSPHWNPAVEEQAEGRMDRIGQTNKCISIHLFTAGSIEGSIHGYQNQKEANTLEVLKETGGHLKRYYNDDDLRAMLFYQPKLDQIKTRLAKLPPVPEARKQSRDLSFLTHHPLVLDMTRHKALYRQFSSRFTITNTAVKVTAIGGKRKHPSLSLDDDKSTDADADDKSLGEPVTKRLAEGETDTLASLSIDASSDHDSVTTD